MKLLYCSNEQLLPLLGGGAAGNLKIMQKFVERGHEVTVRTPLYIDPKPIEAKYGVRMLPFSPFYMHRTASFRLPRYAAYTLLSMLDLQRVAARDRYDAIFLRNCILAPATYLSRFLYGVPVALSMTDVIAGFLYESRMPRALVDLLVRYEKAMALQADRLFVITEEMRHYLIGDQSASVAERVFVSLDGVDTVNFDPARFTEEDRREVRAEIGIEGPLVMYHGIIDPFHGIRVMREIVADALSRTDLNFLLIAKGDGYERLKSDLRGPRVVCLDFIPYEAIPRYIHAADAGMIPYLANFNLDKVYTLKLLEYLAMGANSVAFELAAIRRAFEGKPYMGIAREPSEFVDLLVQATRKPRSEEASRLIHSRFSWDQVTTGICERTEEMVQIRGKDR